MQPADGPQYVDLHRFLSPAQLDVGALSGQRTDVIACPKKMVGRVIGKNGETIKALQNYTGAQIQIDQRVDPTRVSIAGPPKALITAHNMVQDIVAGTFKGFAMLRAYTHSHHGARSGPGYDQTNNQAPVYIRGYGFVPPSQFTDAAEAEALANFTDYQTFPGFQSGYAPTMPSPLIHPGMQGLQGMQMYDGQFGPNNTLSNALVAQQLQMTGGAGRMGMHMAPGMQQMGGPQLSATPYGANGFGGLQPGGDPNDLAAQLGAMNLNPAPNRAQAISRSQEGIPIPARSTLPTQQHMPVIDPAYPGGSAPANINF